MDLGLSISGVSLKKVSAASSASSSAGDSKTTPGADKQKPVIVAVNLETVAGAAGDGDFKDEEEFDFSGDMDENSEVYKFDHIVGVLEDFIMEPSFNTLQKDFFDKHCQEFEDSDENKLSYTTIFQEYVEKLESAITSYLKKHLKDFDMEAFLKMCEAREAEISGDVFEVLSSLGDFATFKSLILEHKQLKTKAANKSDASSMAKPAGAAAPSAGKPAGS